MKSGCEICGNCLLRTRCFHLSLTFSACCSLYALAPAFSAAVHKHLKANERLSCVGSTSALGNWDVKHKRDMQLSTDHGNFRVWTTDLEVGEAETVEYKYLIVTEPEMEEGLGDARLLSLPLSAPESFTVVDRLGQSARSLAHVSAGPSFCVCVPC
jgi:hypothetical protein